MVVTGIEDDIFFKLFRERTVEELFLSDRFHQGFQRLIDRDGLDAHADGQSPGGHVIRQLGFGLEIFADVGIVLIFKYILDKRAVRLGQGNDIGLFVEHGVADPRRVGELENPNIRFEQDLHEALGHNRVVLLARDDEGVGRLVFAPAMFSRAIWKVSSSSSFLWRTAVFSTDSVACRS